MSPELPPDVVHVRQMGLTHAEFFRILPGVVAGLRHRVAAGEVCIEDGPRRATMTLGPETERRLGAMRLPGFELRLEFFGYEQAEIDAFLARFDTVFHRGGG